MRYSDAIQSMGLVCSCVGIARENSPRGNRFLRANDSETISEKGFNCLLCIYAHSHKPQTFERLSPSPSGTNTLTYYFYKVR